MPRGDGTGPAGMGPMTGRAAGYCAGFPVAGFMNPVPALGFGRGRGLGLGRGMGFRGGRGAGMGRGAAWGGRWAAPYGAPYGAPPVAYAGPTAGQEMDVLKGQAEYFEGALEDIKKRIAELEAADSQV